MIDLVREIIRRIETQYTKQDLVSFQLFGDGSWGFDVVIGSEHTSDELPLYSSHDQNLSELLEKLKDAKQI
jgi:hypothetical protein